MLFYHRSWEAGDREAHEKGSLSDVALRLV
jgi:hypothetical protein